jgi:precorrin-3B synthase
MAVHQAADGGLARVRLRGGVLTAAQLRVLATAATDLGDGQLELTSRANVQVRGLSPGGPADLSQRLYEAGLLPSITHERVRNIVVSPLSGLDESSLYDVLPLAADLDARLCATPALADLPGRFLFTLDDGRGDLASLAADTGIRALGVSSAALLVAGAEVRTIPYADVPATLVAVAEAFLTERAKQNSEAWRIAELPAPADLLPHLAVPIQTRVHRPTTGKPPVGACGRAVVGAVPLGRLTAEQARVLADVAERRAGTVRVTPWRSVVVPGATVSEIEQVGLIVDAGSAWIGMTGCAGRPGCAKAFADVRADAGRALPQLTAGRAVHWSGCDRRCGRPPGSVDVVATSNGYVIDGRPAEDVTAAVAAARRNT